MIEIKRVALYARFSSDHQRTESINAQIRGRYAESYLLRLKRSSLWTKTMSNNPFPLSAIIR